MVVRLSRGGAKKYPKYRVAVADQRFSATGRFLEVVGHFDPFSKKPDGLNLKMDRIRNWIDKGAQPTQRVKSLIKKYEKQVGR